MASERDLVVLLKACARQKDLLRGWATHATILERGLLTSNRFIGSTLLNMYAKCGALAKAQQVFDEIPFPDAVSWNALISGYAQHGHGEEALLCFDRIKRGCLFVDAMTFASTLKACASIGAVLKGKEIHDAIAKTGWLLTDSVLGTALVDMYAKCGSLLKAQQVFDQLPIRDVVSWNALISGYAQHEQADDALDCLERMKREGLSPNVVTFSCILKACGSIGVVENGIEIHDEIVRMGLLGQDSVLGTALVDMYVKCGSLTRAQQIFDELPVWDVVLWNALCTGYYQHGHSERALRCFEQMKQESLYLDETTFLCALKACASIGDTEKGKEIHAEIVKDGLGKAISIGNALVDMYVKCGAFEKAQYLFDEFLVKDVVAWNALISGYTKYGKGEEALKCFEQMQGEGLSPDGVTFLGIIKACYSIGTAEKGKEIHAEIVRMDFLAQNSVLGSALVDMYAKCGALAIAQEVFNELPSHDVVSWTGLISAYVRHEQAEEALRYFERMQGDGFSPNAVTFSCILKACGIMGAIEKGAEFHAEIVRMGLQERNVVLGNALVDLYAKCGAFAMARQLFNEFPIHDVVSWNVLLAGYALFEKHDVVLDSYDKMIEEGIEPSLVTFTLVLNACRHLGLVDKAQMYFETFTRSSGIISTVEHCTCMVELFGQAGHFDKVMVMIEKIPSSGCLPIWFALLGACQKWGNVKLGRLAFEHAIRLDDKFFVAYVCMSNVYAAAGMIEDAGRTFAKAREVFDQLPFRSLDSWNALIAGYCDHGRGEEALNCFYEMECEGLSPDPETCLYILKACGLIGAVEKGKEMHDEIVRVGFLAAVTVLGNSLVDMYAKCGALATAKQLFRELPVQDIVSWTALIAGYCHHGHGEDAINCFEQMKAEGFVPDAVTFACILKACGSVGAVEKGQMYFDLMSASYGICPNSEHQTCMVELLGSSGHFDKAIGVIKKMPCSDYFPVWFALLNACQKWGNVKLGRFAFDNAVQLDKDFAASYVCMGKIYAAAGMQEDAERIEAMIMENEACT